MIPPKTGSLDPEPTRPKNVRIAVFLLPAIISGMFLKIWGVREGLWAESLWFRLSGLIWLGVGLGMLFVIVRGLNRNRGSLVPGASLLGGLFWWVALLVYGTSGSGEWQWGNTWRCALMQAGGTLALLWGCSSGVSRKSQAHVIAFSIAIVAMAFNLAAALNWAVCDHNSFGHRILGHGVFVLGLMGPLLFLSKGFLFRLHPMNFKR